MLKFQVFEDSKPATQCVIRNAHLLGPDHSAMRGGITFDTASGQIVCDKKESGSAGLAIQQGVGDCGELTLQTCLLPDRDEPYSLLLELARHRLMTLYNKFEDWGMFDVIAETPVQRRADLARKLFIEALCAQHDEPAKSAKLARDALIAAIDGSEELALAHADLLLNRRKTAGSLPKHLFGCGLPLSQNSDRLRGALSSNFDFLTLPAPWKMLTPEEAGYQWEQMDNWVQWATQSGVPVTVGPLVSFEPDHLPEWMFIWEHDYETVRDMVYEHVERVVTRYKDHIGMWNLMSGLHVNTHFSFSFDQVMDLTRMAAVLVKKIQPHAKVLIEVRQPFGEYFSANQRSIPPLMYADLLVQSAVPFDGFVLKLLMGQAVPGQYVRDLMQLSNLLDYFAPFGKPINVVTGVPSDLVTQEMIALETNQEAIDSNCGTWRKPWSTVVQSHWLEAMYKIVISKPYVESITWNDLVDHQEMELPLSGLIGEDMAPKNTFRRLVNFRRNLLGIAAPAGTTTPAAGAADQEPQAAVSPPPATPTVTPPVTPQQPVIVESYDDATLNAADALAANAEASSQMDDESMDDQNESDDDKA